MPTPCSKPATGSCCPMPRMKALSVVLVPRVVSSVTLGVVLASSVMSRAPSFSSWAPVNAVTAIGTLSKVSARRRAVTTMVAALSASSAGASLRVGRAGSGAPAGGCCPSCAHAGAAPASAATAVPILRAVERRVRVIGSSPVFDSVAWLGLAQARQARREVAQGAVEELRLLQMRRMARAFEGDRTGVRQRADEMVGRIRAVEVALGAVDDERRLPDAPQHRAEILADQGGPEGADRRAVGARKLLAGPGRQRPADRVERLGEDRRPRRRRESAEILLDRAAARIAGRRRKAEPPLAVVH